MAFVSRQPLGKGNGLRNRKHRPRRAEILISAPIDAFSIKHDVALEIRAHHDDGEYQELLITSEELKAVASAALSECSKPTRLKIVEAALAGASERDLLNLLVRLLKQRQRAR